MLEDDRSNNYGLDSKFIGGDNRLEWTCFGATVNGNDKLTDDGEHVWPAVQGCLYSGACKFDSDANTQLGDTSICYENDCTLASSLESC